MSFSDDSICALLPVKNGDAYLNSLIPSILNMLSPSDSFIVINDGSTDSTRTIVESFSEMDSRLLVINTPSVGLVSALNLGIARADKKWIARFDVDDEYAPDRLAEQRKLLKNSVSVVFSDYKIISKSGINLGLIPTAVFPAATLLSLISSQRTAHPSSIINRSFLVEVGGYLENEYPVEDLGLWLRISKKGQLVSFPDTLLNYRISNSSVSSQNRDRQNLKAASLIENYPDWEIALNDSLVELGASVSKYKELSHGYYRIALHLRDILKVGRLINIDLDMNSILKFFSLRDFVMLFFASIDILIKTFFRRLYRQIQI